MKWLKKNNCPWDKLAFKYASEKGVLKNMKWFNENNFSRNYCDRTIIIGCVSGIVENIKWFNEK